jgi:ssRNA-specific RNase YbeY (16S rRNA maturation enzyme)
MRLVETVLYLLNVEDNAKDFGVSLTRVKAVMAHGLLHCCGYGDKKRRRANYET